jgi:hypothetical protein
MAFVEIPDGVRLAELHEVFQGAAAAKVLARGMTRFRSCGRRSPDRGRVNGQRAAKLADRRRLLAVTDPVPSAPAADYRERYQQLTGHWRDNRSGEVAS